MGIRNLSVGLTFFLKGLELRLYISSIASKESSFLNHSSDFSYVVLIFLSSNERNKSYISYLPLGISTSKCGAFLSLISFTFVLHFNLGVWIYKGFKPSP